MAVAKFARKFLRRITFKHNDTLWLSTLDAAEVNVNIEQRYCF
jgi:hypothetical protein